MRRVGMALAVGVAGCAVELPPACSETPLELCDGTAGCDLLEAYAAFEDVDADRACWETAPRAVACEPTFDADRCQPTRTFARPAAGGSCRWFDTSCIPQDWEVCDQLPTLEVCPVCADDALPPWRAPSLVVDGSTGDARTVAVGDLDNDGVPDLIYGNALAGMTLVFGPVDAGVSVIVESDDRDTSATLTAAIGDVTGDGVADLVLGSPRARRSAGTERAGGVWVFPGPLARESLDVEDAPIRIEGAMVGDELGASVRLGDVNADGALDLISWARDASDAVAAGGRLDLFLNPLEAGLYTPADAVARIAGGGDFGEVVALSDLDDDGNVEVLVGGVARNLMLFEAPLEGDLLELEGVGLEARILGGTSTATRAIAAGDVNDDGAQDLVLGVPEAAGGEEGNERGEVLVVLGPVLLEAARLEVAPLLAGRCQGDLSGAALAVHDLDGDGTAGIVVGLGARNGSAVGGLWLPGPIVAGDRLVSSGAERLGDGAWSGGLTVGDVSGDGVDDLVSADPITGTVRIWHSQP